MVRVVDLVPDPRNAKGHHLDGIRASFRRFGYADTILEDQRTGQLISGHGRQEALAGMELDQEPAPDGVVVAEDGAWWVPVVTGWASRDDAEAEAYLVAANRWTEAGGWVVDPLAQALERIRDTPQGLDGVGYTAQQVEDLLAAALPPPDLDALAAHLGDGNDSDHWPALRLVVPPELLARYQDLVAGITGDVERLTQLLDWAEAGRTQPAGA